LKLREKVALFFDKEETRHGNQEGGERKKIKKEEKNWQPYLH
jgi:hypothetical protein